MHVEDITYTFEDREMVGHLAYDDSQSGPRPAVLLSHEGYGLDDHVKGRAERLAALGYVAFALDYLGGGIPLPPEQAMERLGPLMGDPARIRRLGLAGLDVLLAQGVTDSNRVAAIGYCFGGTISLEMARSGADLKAIVGFHPGLTVSPDSKNIKGSAHVHRDRRPVPSARPTPRVRAGHDRRRCGRLEPRGLWRHRAQLHQPAIR